MKKKNIPEDKIMESIYRIGRDNARTPMQWADSVNAGFTNGESWIKCNPNYKNINVKESLNNPNSIYYYYKKLINLRKNNLVFVYGNYRSILNDNEQIYTYIRQLDNQSLLVVLNFCETGIIFNLPDEIKYNKKELLLCNYNVDKSKNIKNFNLRPYEARVYRLFI